jgi:hypothetical protein
VPLSVSAQKLKYPTIQEIKIEVENPGHELKLNMPAEAEVLLSELKK